MNTFVMKITLEESREVEKRFKARGVNCFINGATYLIYPNHEYPKERILKLMNKFLADIRERQKVEFT